ncbi:MAG: tetratricopeptide repeat protein [Nitrospira sp.]|nr:tetratricopeptide repeat protein [Nitrospira sp.]
MPKLFISHSSKDDAFVRDLRSALADQGQGVWVDSRELRGGDPLWPEIMKAIEDATAYAVIISTDALQSIWVGKELHHALDLRDKRGKDQYRVIPLSLNGTKLGALGEFFGEEPFYISVSNQAGGVEAAIDPVLTALGMREPADVPPTLQPKMTSLEELVLELTDLRFHEQDGIPRASALARLVYESSTPGQPQVYSTNRWRLVAPIGPIEAEDLRWYLEKYAIWPSHYFRERARKVEENLAEWGKRLYESALPLSYTANVVQAWNRIDDHAKRRFSVNVDSTLETGASHGELLSAKEAATLLLGLPWELLHNGEGYLFQGAKPTRVRRRIPNTKALDVSVVTTPIRILLVTARPEDDACGYIDHRASALPLVEAMEALPGLVNIHVLTPPTLSALREELDRARGNKVPYHVIHFDGHGVYNRAVGLGGLCFELPEDIGKLDKRRHALVCTNELAPILNDHRIALVFLEACQSGHAEKASGSLASELLKIGVGSVIAMSHSVLVETARRFVKAFYEALAEGKRVGDAMLEGQRRLKDDAFRGRIFGGKELRLEDWSVPVLFQAKDDPQLFTTIPAKQTQEDFRAALLSRLGKLPNTPETGFIGRSRELLALQRLFQDKRYAVILGQGGEGKTALAAEFARWMVRSHHIHRSAFVSVEIHSDVAGILDALGRQLVGANYSVAAFEGLEKATLPIERILREQPTLLVVDNMESILLPPFVEKQTPEMLSEVAGEELKDIFVLCQRLLKAGDTRLLFTSRESLPAPFDAEGLKRELHELDRNDAIKLVERALDAVGANADATTDSTHDEIEELVDAVHCHARTLALLASMLRNRGVQPTTMSLVHLMAEMEARYPCDREKSLYASIELSLRRMTKANRDRAAVLGVFHGGVNLDVLCKMMQWREGDVANLAHELIATGLATRNYYNHLTLNPPLSIYLRGQMEEAQRAELTACWKTVMLEYVLFLRGQQVKDVAMTTTLTVLELENFFSLLELIRGSNDADSIIGLSSTLYELLKPSGKLRPLKGLGQIRDASLALGGAWTPQRFGGERNRIEQQLEEGKLPEALNGALHLLNRARSEGERAYPVADYDLAIACQLLAHVLIVSGRCEDAMPLLEEARQRFKSFAKSRGSNEAEGWAAHCLSDKGRCFYALGRLDDAEAAYEDAIRKHQQAGDDSSVAIIKSQLGDVWMNQRRYPQALTAHKEARELFIKWNDSPNVAQSWHRCGIVYQKMNQPEAAEDAYRQSLAITVQLRDIGGQANTLGQLGTLYDSNLVCLEYAVSFHRQAAEKYVEIGDVAKEGVVRSNLALTLFRLRSLVEARKEICRAITCKESFGHTVERWKSWHILAEIESAAGNDSAATKAQRHATTSYLAYRRDGGDNHYDQGRLALGTIERLRAGGAELANSFLQQFAASRELPANMLAYLNALRSVVAGSRDPALADAPQLDYMASAEILFLIENLVTPN